MSNKIESNTFTSILPSRISLENILEEKLGRFPATYSIAETISLALLRLNKWTSAPIDMADSLSTIISDSSTNNKQLIEIILRLAKVPNEKGFEFLLKIINSEANQFNIAHKRFAFTVLLHNKIKDINITNEELYKTLLIFNENFENGLTIARNIGNEKIKELTTLKFFKAIFLDDYVKFMGHNIHKLKAKDTTGRWAYYFVLVESEFEQAFLQAIEGDGTIDLENYGRVVASCYGESPTIEVREYLKEKYGFDV